MVYDFRSVGNRGIKSRIVQIKQILEKYMGGYLLDKDEVS